MKKFTKCLSVLVLLALLGTMLMGCSSINSSRAMEIDQKEQAAEKLLEEKGYQVVSSGGKTEIYEVNRDILAHPHYALIWGIQKIDADRYIGKTVETYEFLVENHPLLLEVAEDVGRVRVWVLFCEDEVLGGYTFPDYDEPHYGGVYSLEGETLEEVTEMRFQAWRKNWEQKYQSSKQ
ncbi:hypothetical protein [Isachenkonia alkalipeptolytica]|uniref:Lipoprotein n=1 Tax=Isachenkonia alkalipeptolytica TaxID=2565777 RepID=A0AA43XJP6_9CLOT|nr:hypothetical protein [Isachenkonia alkalipeptolytica]NBG87862.1 hypothetical protein [Isachenkonia alkalipeptolytica]